MNTLKHLWKDLWYDPWQPRYMWPLIVINIAGSALGYWWYRAQLMENPVALWILISDSPLSTTFFALALIFALLKSRKPFITAIGLVTTVKYGLWAIVILTHYWFVTQDFRLLEIGLWLGHLGMALEGFIFMRNALLSRAAVIVAFSWMILNDFVDYVFGLHPYLFMSSQLNLGIIAAVFMTIFAGALMIKRSHEDI